MHGYDSRHEKMQGFAIAHGKRIRPAFVTDARLVDLCPTLCDAVGVPFPMQNEGKSLLAVSPTGRDEAGTS
jgi:arylsulfatase A-like enzyme